MQSLVVSETFGPTIQGEGRYIGTPAAFIRLGGCNLGCIWCDSAYTWRYSDHKPHLFAPVYSRKEELTHKTDTELLEWASTLSVRHMVLTGGEPMLQQDRLLEMIEELMKQKWTVEFETAGTISPHVDLPSRTKFTVSPKLANSGNTFLERYKQDVLDDFAVRDSVFKFVVSCVDDLEEIDLIVERSMLPKSRIYIMPEGTDAEMIARRTAMVADAVVLRGYSLTTRLHVLAWGNKRGV